jgi:hypothetical protein
MHAGVGKRLIWQRDRVLLDDIVFRLELAKSDDWDLGDRCFLFYKTKELVDRYLQFWSSREGLPIESILEIGIYDGGSVAFWFENFQPKKHVAIDLVRKGDSEYFKWYVASRGLQDRLKTYWGVDQADEERLREIVHREFPGPLDLIVDDASHLFAPTVKSFETLFPLVRPGGLYIIEDWGWGYDQFWMGPSSPLGTEKIALSKFVIELLEAVGSARGVINSLIACNGFVAIERGVRIVESDTPFKVRDEIMRYPRRREPLRIPVVARAKMHIPRFLVPRRGKRRPA